MTFLNSSPLEPADVRVFDNAVLPNAVATWISEKIGEAIAARGRANIALAGGSTPRRVYEALADASHRTTVDWSLVHVYFGDERAVGPTHPDSNFRMATEALLALVPVPAAQVHRMPAEQSNLALAGQQYDRDRNFNRSGSTIRRVYDATSTA